MKIYIVTTGEYSDYSIDAVFLEKEQAEYYCAEHNGDYWLARIEEYDTDEHVIDCKKSVFKCWTAIFTGETLEGVMFREYSFDFLQSKLPKEDVYQNENMCWRMNFSTAKDKTEEQAKKIAADLFAQLKYNKEMGIDPYEC